MVYKWPICFFLSLRTPSCVGTVASAYKDHRMLFLGVLDIAIIGVLDAKICSRSSFIVGFIFDQCESATMQKVE